MNNVTVVREGSSIQLMLVGVDGTATVDLTQEQATEIANALHVPDRARKVRTRKSHPRSRSLAMSGGAPGKYDDEDDT